MTQVHGASTSFFRVWSARVAIALVVVGTTIAVFGLLTGRLGPQHVRWMFTAYVGAFFLAAAQASGSAWERDRSIIGKAGQLTSLAGFAVFIWGMWFEGFLELWFWKSEIALLLFSLSAAQTSLLSIARVPPPLAWLRVFSVVCGWFVTGSIIFMMLAEWIHPEWIRWIGVSSLLCMASSCILFVVHRLEAE